MWLMLATQNEDKYFVTRHTKMLNYLLAQMTEEQKTSATLLAAQCKKTATARVLSEIHVINNFSQKSKVVHASKRLFDQTT